MNQSEDICRPLVGLGAKRVAEKSRPEVQSRPAKPQRKDGERKGITGLKIKDEFSDIPISRQRLYQLRNLRDGKCALCNRRLVTRTYCEMHRKNQYDYMKKFNRLNPHKFKASVLTKNAIKSGKLIRKPCAICGEPISEAHHEDYAKPLEIIWLCQKHHLEKHGKKHWRMRARKHLKSL